METLGIGDKPAFCQWWAHSWSFWCQKGMGAKLA
jgi:hypothetical protein